MPTNSHPAPRPANPEAISTHEFYRRLFADELDETPAPPRQYRGDPDDGVSEAFFHKLFAQGQRPAAPAQPAPAQPFNPANPEEISTQEFYRRLFADELDETPPAPAARPVPSRNDDRALSLEEFYRELFAEPARPLALGPRPGLEPPALPTQFRRVRGGNRLVSYELLVDEHGRIAARHENMAGSETYCIYEYDEAGHLLRVWWEGRLSEEYAYDDRGARAASWNARQGQWTYAYDQGGRLASAGPWKFAYADDSSLREAWTPRLSYHFAANQADGLTRIVLPGGRVLRSETLAPGLPVEKYVDAVPVESLTWRSPLQLATYRDRQRGVHMQFHYVGSERLPQAVTVQDGSGSTSYLLGYDQVGSLKAVAAMDGEHEGRIVKLVDYDAFGNVLADSNPNLFLPLAFVGGLRDRFTGLVRFCHRDYDPTVGRFTAPDPLGDTGGDHDLYDYCMDEPVGRVDPEGTVAFLLPLLAGLGGMGGATGLAWGAVKAAQKGAEIAAGTLGDETLKAELPEKVEAMDKATTDALTKATAINAGIGAAATAAVAAPTLARGAVQAAKAAPEAIAAAAGKGAEMAGKVKDAAVNVVLDPAKNQFVQDAITAAAPGTPPPSWGGLTGAAAAKAVDEYGHIRDWLKK